MGAPPVQKAPDESPPRIRGGASPSSSPAFSPVGSGSRRHSFCQGPPAAEGEECALNGQEQKERAPGPLRHRRSFGARPSPEARQPPSEDRRDSDHREASAPGPPKQTREVGVGPELEVPAAQPQELSDFVAACEQPAEQPTPAAAQPGDPGTSAGEQELARQLQAERAQHAAAVSVLAARLAALEAENESLATGLIRRADNQSWDDQEEVVPRPWRCAPQPPGQLLAPHEYRSVRRDSAGADPVELEDKWMRLSSSSSTLEDGAQRLRAARIRLAGVEAPARDLIQQLEECFDEQFVPLCNAIAHRVPQLATADALRLAEALLAQMSQTARAPGCGRYWPTVSLMELLCTSRQCVEALPATVLESLLEEIREHMAYCSWMRCLDSWGERLEMADRASAMLLSNVNPSQASILLQDLQLRPDELADCPFLAESVEQLQARAQEGAPAASAREPSGTVAKEPSLHELSPAGTQEPEYSRQTSIDYSRQTSIDAPMDQGPVENHHEPLSGVDIEKAGATVPPLTPMGGLSLQAIHAAAQDDDLHPMGTPRDAPARKVGVSAPGASAPAEEAKKKKRGRRRSGVQRWS